MLFGFYFPLLGRGKSIKDYLVFMKLLKAERREKRRKPKMAVHGRGVKKIVRIIIEKKYAPSRNKDE